VPAIVSKDTFDAAQELLRRNLTDFNRGNTNNRDLLKGLVRCGKCGAAYCGSFNSGTIYYRCTNRIHTFPEPKWCDAPHIRADRLEPLVWDKLCEVIQQPDLMFLAHKKHEYDEGTDGDNLDKSIQLAENRLKNTEKEAERLLDIYTDGVISKDTLKERMLKLNDKRESLQTELAKLLKTQEQAALNERVIKGISNYCQVIAENLQGIGQDIEAKRYILTSLIDRVEIFQDHIKIHTAIPSLDDDDMRVLSQPLWIV